MKVDRSKYVIMGIDPGSKACGWAVGTMDGVLIDSGSIVHPDKMETHLRIFETAERLAEIGLKYGVQSYYCEAPLVYQGAKTALVLGALSGIINYIIWKTSEGLAVNFIESSLVRSMIGVPSLKRPKGKELPDGAVKANALKWIRTLMRDMGLPYKKSKPVPLGEEDRVEAIGIFWAGCSELSAAIDGAIDEIDVALADMTAKHEKEKKRK